MACLPLLFFVGIGGRLLPTWMFLNSMQLFVHVPMLEIYLPGNLSYFLADYLGRIRLKSGSIAEGINELDAALSANTPDSYLPFLSLLKQVGYAH